VKNTFIDELCPASQGDEALPLKRAVTAPLPKLQAIADDATEFEEEDGAGICADMMDAPLVAKSPTDSMSDASTGLPDCADMETVASDSSSVQGEEDEEVALSSLIRRECAFLRIASSALVPLDSAQSAKLPVRDVSQSLRICIHGLPAQKRMKWQNPLAWSMAITLQRSGCAAFVKRGQLFAPLHASSAADAEVVRVDLCAPRASDC